MNGNVGRSFVLVVVVVSVMLVFTGVANTQEPETNKSADKGWLALDKVDGFTKALDKAGFSVQEGVVEYMDWVKETCAGTWPDTALNNPWPNAYLTLKFAPHEGVGKPLTPWVWQLREDEAVILVGQTPPPAAYFSYVTLLAFLPISPWPPEEGYLPRRVAPQVGDAINVETVKTIGPDPYEAPMVYIITGHRETEQRVRAAARAAGYPDAIINVETISPALGPLGIKDKGSWFFFAHRVALPDDKDALKLYLQEAGERYRVFRVTPEKALAPDPEPVPVLRVRGTGHTEMDLYPALKRLRQAILDEYATDGKCEGERKELDTRVFSTVTRDGRELILEKPYVGLQRGIQVIGATRDTNYLGTYPNFMLREGVDEFVIVYGVNHQKTGKVTYASASLYSDKDRWFGIATQYSPYFGDSARQYLPDDPEADMLYAIKVARHCDEGEEYCLQVDPPEFRDIKGETYACDLDNLDTPDWDPSPFDLNEQEMFFVFRSYLEPATLAGPDDNELLYDRAIYFGPYEVPEP